MSRVSTSSCASQFDMPLVLVWSANHAARVGLKTGTTTNEVSTWTSSRVKLHTWLAQAALGTYQVDSTTLSDAGQALVYRGTGTYATYSTSTPNGITSNADVAPAPLWTTKALSAPITGRTLAITFTLLAGGSYTGWAPCGWGFETSPDVGVWWYLFVSGDGTLILRWRDDSNGGWSPDVTLATGMVVAGDPATLVLHFVTEGDSVRVRSVCSLTSYAMLSQLVSGTQVRQTPGRLAITSNGNTLGDAYNPTLVHAVVTLPASLSDAQMQSMCSSLHRKWVQFIYVWSADSSADFVYKTDTTTNEVSAWASRTLSPVSWRTAAAGGTYLMTGTSPNDSLYYVSGYYTTRNTSTTKPFLTNPLSTVPGLRTATTLDPNSYTFAVVFQQITPDNPYVATFLWTFIHPTTKQGYNLFLMPNGEIWIWLSLGTGFTGGNTRYALGPKVPYNTLVTAVVNVEMINGYLTARIASSREASGVLTIWPGGSLSSNGGRFSLFANDEGGGQWSKIHHAMILPLRLSDTEMRGLCNALQARWQAM